MKGAFKYMWYARWTPEEDALIDSTSDLEELKKLLPHRSEEAIKYRLNKSPEERAAYLWTQEEENEVFKHWLEDSLDSLVTHRSETAIKARIKNLRTRMTQEIIEKTGITPSKASGFSRSQIKTYLKLRHKTGPLQKASLIQELRHG